jgi:glycosyltransferase involved in cell wall biosynthesis
MTTAGAAPSSATIEAPPTLLASVVVPVRNDRQAYLERLLAALELQTIPRARFEVLIGDDGSTDGSTDELETVDGWVRVLPGPPTNSYAARNRAARAASSQVLAFCDSDCLPAPDWLEQGIAALERCDVAAGGIEFELPERPTVWTWIDMESTKDHAAQVRIGNAETANLFVRREVYDALDGFDDTLPEHGDFDFAERVVEAGFRLEYAPEVLVRHPTRDTAQPYLKMVWVMNRWYAARASRARKRPDAVKLRCWVPFFSTIRGRRRYGLSLLLDRRRLADHGVRPRLRDDLAALPLIYLVLPNIRNVAQLRGWWDGHRLR